MPSKRVIPNLLTFARVAAVPVSLGMMLWMPLQAMPLFWIFLAAALTDFFDGYLARKWNAVTPLGTMLDQISDKLLVAVMLLYLLYVRGLPLLLPVAVILLRELYISGLREFLALRRIPLPVSKLGKWKTTTQMAAIALMLGAYAYNPPSELVFPCSIVRNAHGALVPSCTHQPYLLQVAERGGLPLLYLAAGLALLSAITYSIAAIRGVKAASA